MLPISECRQYLPPDWSDDQIREYLEMVHDFLSGMFDLLEKSNKTTIV